jgi:pilus assembly protein Flp/PilA
MGGGELMLMSLATKLQLALAQTREEEDGQGLTEYALILTLIAVVAIAALTLFGGKVTSYLSTVATSV